MKRNRLAAAVAAVTVLGAPVAMAAAASAGAQPAASAAAATTVKVEKTNIGSILVTGNGSVLYLFTHDHGAVNSCAKIRGCSAVWPPLYTTGKPAAGAGARASLLGTIKLGARLQVTYAGHPLYGYAQNSNTFSTGYVGTAEFGGSWDAVSASGGAVK
jgi:predicted lipoprotein with Yx(FWY)xxD motif